jgi:hypothetical protein
MRVLRTASVRRLQRGKAAAQTVHAAAQMQVDGQVKSSAGSEFIGYRRTSWVAELGSRRSCSKFR